MDVVAPACTIISFVIGAEDGDVWTLARSCIEDKRYQMGFWIVQLADLAIGISSASIEIAQHRPS
jgi:hypothetical protein